MSKSNKNPSSVGSGCKEKCDQFNEIPDVYLFKKTEILKIFPKLLKTILIFSKLLKFFHISEIIQKTPGNVQIF
jgi:hypothetical protein